MVLLCSPAPTISREAVHGRDTRPHSQRYAPSRVSVDRIRGRTAVDRVRADIEYRDDHQARCRTIGNTRRARSDGLGQRADRHLKIRQHLQIFFGRATQCRQVVADDERIDSRGKSKSLEFAQRYLATTGITKND